VHDLSWSPIGTILAAVLDYCDKFCSLSSVASANDSVASDNGLVKVLVFNYSSVSWRHIHTILVMATFNKLAIQLSSSVIVALT
jgi:hypothetical protein